jgi:catechol 2,3-dioxygenase-like lactoylglutathione lyase family enzyme
VEVLSSRILLQPNDFELSRRWYCEVLGLRIYREYGVEGRVTGVVLFLGGGFLELTTTPPRPGNGPVPITLWLQVPDLDAEYERLAATGEVTITAAPTLMPWGLKEMWLEDPDGIRLVLVEVPEGHPIRTRLGQ